DVATGPLSAVVDSPTKLVVNANDCGQGVGPGASCTLELRFHPSEAGPRRATLTLRDAAGDSVSFSATGNGRTPARLILQPDSDSSSMFGDVLVGLVAEQTFVVVNEGQEPSGPLSVTLMT